MFFKTIKSDQSRYAKQDFKGFLKALMNPCFRVIFWIRVCQTTSIWNPLGMLARLISKCTQIRFGIQIPHITRIGAGLFIGHFGGIVISSEANIGANCNIAQGVTIGRINKGKRKGAPIIGDKVWIGPNAVIAGNVTIGDNAMIAPLTFVNIDVPANSLAIGNPAKIVEGKTSEDYINFY